MDRLAVRGVRRDCRRVGRPQQVAVVARAGAGRVALPKVEVEDGEVVPARAGSVCEMCVRAGDAVEGLKEPNRGPGGRHGRLPPGCSMSAREDGYAVRPIQLGPANGLSDEVDRGEEKDEVWPAPVAPGAGGAGPAVLLQIVCAGG